MPEDEKISHVTILKPLNSLHKRLTKLTIRSKFEFQKLVAKFSFMTHIVAKIKFRHIEKEKRSAWGNVSRDYLLSADIGKLVSRLLVLYASLPTRQQLRTA